MLSTHQLTDLYVNEKQEVVIVQKNSGDDEVSFTIPMSEAIKLKKHLIEIL